MSLVDPKSYFGGSGSYMRLFTTMTSSLLKNEPIPKITIIKTIFKNFSIVFLLLAQKNAITKAIARMDAHPPT